MLNSISKIGDKFLVQFCIACATVEVEEFVDTWPYTEKPDTIGPGVYAEEWLYGATTDQNLNA